MGGGAVGTERGWEEERGQGEEEYCCRAIRAPLLPPDRHARTRMRADPPMHTYAHLGDIARVHEARKVYGGCTILLGDGVVQDIALCHVGYRLAEAIQKGVNKRGDATVDLAEIDVDGLMHNCRGREAQCRPARRLKGCGEIEDRVVVALAP